MTYELPPHEHPHRDEPLPVPGPRLGILISGEGTNMMKLLEAAREGSLDAEPVVVISNRAKARGVERAKSAGVPAEVIPHRAFPDRESFDRALVEALRRHRVDLVCLAGFMRILSPVLTRAFPDRILNIHPSLLPAFPGIRAHHQALDRGVKISGATVHLVDEYLDHGPILLQESVPVEDDDTPDTLADRVRVVEHRLLPEAVRRLRRGGYRIVGRRVTRRAPE